MRGENALWNLHGTKSECNWIPGSGKERLCSVLHIRGQTNTQCFKGRIFSESFPRSTTKVACTGLLLRTLVSHAHLVLLLLGGLVQLAELELQLSDDVTLTLKLLLLRPPLRLQQGLLHLHLREDARWVRLSVCPLQLAGQLKVSRCTEFTLTVIFLSFCFLPPVNARPSNQE